jgi:hypothetical protein
VKFARRWKTRVRNRRLAYEAAGIPPPFWQFIPVHEAKVRELPAAAHGGLDAEGQRNVLFRDELGEEAARARVRTTIAHIMAASMSVFPEVRDRLAAAARGGPPVNPGNRAQGAATGVAEVTMSYFLFVYGAPSIAYRCADHAHD